MEVFVMMTMLVDATVIVNYIHLIVTFRIKRTFVAQPV